MKIPKKIIDHEPSRPVHEFSIVTFKKTDPERGSKKGYVGTVVDMVDHEKYGYTVETPSGDTASFFRHEFRLATPEDLARFDTAMAKKKADTTTKTAFTGVPELPKDVEETDVR